MKTIRTFFWSAFFLIILGGIFVFFKFKGLQKNYSDSHKVVYIQKSDIGFQLIRNGNPFFIKGACGDSHLGLLSEIGGNTIRIYDTINIVKRLDQAAANNLAVVVDIDIPKFTNNYNFYESERNVVKLKKEVTELIRKCKNHPALLIWNLGNEVNYPYVLYKKTLTNFLSKSLNPKENTFIGIFNELITLIHTLDPDHPVSTTVIAGRNKKQIASIYLNSPDLDLLAYNIFGALTTYQFESKQLDFLFGRRPYFIGEFGNDGPWSTECELTSWQGKIEPTSAKKAEQIEARYHLINDNNSGACLGSMFFYWGVKQECTHTWFSLFDEDGHKSEIIRHLQNLWNKKTMSSDSIGIEYMLVDTLGARDNIVLAPEDTVEAEIRLSGNLNALTISWELYPDAWYINGVDDEAKLSPITGRFLSSVENKLQFIAPQNEGPYRLFVYIHDQRGYFATANTPFYVLKNR